MSQGVTGHEVCKIRSKMYAHHKCDCKHRKNEAKSPPPKRRAQRKRKK
jgi:hypothetical protein